MYHMNKKQAKESVLIFMSLLLLCTVTVLLCNAGTKEEAQAETEKPEIEFIMPNSSNEEMMELLKDRNGKLVIEICEGKVLDDEGNGESHYSDGKYYIHYDPDEYHKGDEVLSIFVYNPNTNAEDDITHRVDIKK